MALHENEWRRKADPLTVVGFRMPITYFHTILELFSVLEKFTCLPPMRKPKSNGWNVPLNPPYAPTHRHQLGRNSVLYQRRISWHGYSWSNWLISWFLFFLSSLSARTFSASWTNRSDERCEANHWHMDKRLCRKRYSRCWWSIKRYVHQLCALSTPITTPLTAHSHRSIDNPLRTIHIRQVPSSFTRTTTLFTVVNNSNDLIMQRNPALFQLQLQLHMKGHTFTI